METITLTMKDQKRVKVIEMVFRCELSIESAAKVLDISVRQAYRIKSRIKEKGVLGVIHGNRGKSCPWKIDEAVRERILGLYREKYAGFNDHHFTEKLIENEGVKSISREKVRQLLRGAGVSPKRKRRSPKYRSKRARKEMEGMMLQVDGSPHDWLEGRGERLCLVGAIDDATNKVPAAFFAE
jgi:transposase